MYTCTAHLWTQIERELSFSDRTRENIDLQLLQIVPKLSWVENYNVNMSILQVANNHGFVKNYLSLRTSDPETKAEYGTWVPDLL